MKNLSLILNGVLAVAVAILFYQVNGLKKHTDSTQSNEVTESEGTTQALIESNTNLSDAKIVFVNTDSINEKYNYISDFTKTIRARKSALEAQMESMTLKFQQDYQSYQQSAQAGIASQSELMRQEENLKRQQNELANKELQMQNLGIELEEKNEELNSNVKVFLKKINNGRFDYILSYSDLVPTILLTNPKLDITAEVIKGLNEEYASKKTKK
jgi:outer membrane protein